MADFNQDGRPDLAYTGSPDGLTIRYQGRRDRFETSETFDLRAPSRWRHTLEAADLDGDGRTDLVVLTEEALEVFMQQGDGRLVAAGRYPVTDEDRYLFDLQVRHGTAPRERASNVLPLATDARTMPSP